MPVQNYEGRYEDPQAGDMMSRYEAGKYDDAKTKELFSICSVHKMWRKYNSVFTYNNQQELQVMWRAFGESVWK
jgi:hypothetical protein